MIIVAPSLLSADFLHLEEDMKKFEDSKAQWLHYDVMDGNFVPNISFGPSILKQCCKVTNKFIDVHIMVDNPLDVVDYFDGIRVDMITFHYEACKDIEQCYEVINKIHSKGIKAGISVKPKTDITAINEVLDKVDMVLVMSVEPGFGGQKFMEDMMSKGDYLFNYKKEHNLDYIIEIDGGINGETGKIAAAHHFEVLVAGSYCFANPVSFDSAVDSLINL